MPSTSSVMLTSRMNTNTRLFAVTASPDHFVVTILDVFLFSRFF
jgi:hypothetical protein